MTKKDNQQSSSKQYSIPMEVTAETIRDFGINRDDVRNSRHGTHYVKVVDVPVTEEMYQEYMRPQWREDKRVARHGSGYSYEDWHEKEEAMAKNKNRGLSSIDYVDSPEDTLMKKLIIERMYEVLDELEELDRTIMEMFSCGCSEAEIGKAVHMSQRGAGKRKERILAKLRAELKDYR